MVLTPFTRFLAVIAIIAGDNFFKTDRIDSIYQGVSETQTNRQRNTKDVTMISVLVIGMQITLV